MSLSSYISRFLDSYSRNSLIAFEHKNLQKAAKARKRRKVKMNHLKRMCRR